MPLVSLGEIIEQSKDPGILGISDRAQIIRYIQSALDLTIFKGDLNPTIGTLDTWSDACGFFTCPSFIESVLACNVNGNPSWKNTSWFEFVLGGPGSVGGVGGVGGSGSTGIGSAAIGGWGQVGSVWEDRLWSPTYQGVDTYSCLACVTENPADGNKGLYLIVEGEVDGPPGMGFETAQSIDPATGLTVRGVRVPLMSGLASTDAGVTLFRNITRVIKPVTQGFVKLMAFQPKQGASVRTVGHYGPGDTLPRYRRIRVNSGRAWLRIRYRLAKANLLNDWDVLPIASVEAMLMAIKAVYLRRANRWDEADKCVAVAVGIMNDIQTTEDGGAAQFVLQVDPGESLGTVDIR